MIIIPRRTRSYFDTLKIKKMFEKLSSILILVVVLTACSGVPKENGQEGFLQVEGQRFVDAEGRQVILNGVNFISKEPAEKYMPPQREDTFRKFRWWGFNCIRLGIIWDGLEPEPGRYNEAYLCEIDKRIQWAEENNLYVFLDMHQDLYGAKFSDGAPDWATLDENKPHYKGVIWSDSYLISPAVQTAFDNFWKNSPASDGVGLQDHYANLWKHIAKRYAHNTTVIGYDIMNEPFMGSDAQELMSLFREAYAHILTEKTGHEPPPTKELQEMWADESSRLQAIELITNQDKYSKVVDAVYELSATFEKNHLQPFYQKVADAIREVDNNHILALNHNYFANTGVFSALEATKLSDGSRDSLVTYAAHAYDLVVDTKGVDNPSNERVDFIFDRIADSGKRMNMPVWIGEWGALTGKSPKLVKTAQHLVSVIEKHNFSNTYWAYYTGIEDSPYFQEAIIRPYPQRISGKLESYNYNFQTREFTCSWEEICQTNAPTVIYIPNLRNLSEDEIDITPKAAKFEVDFYKASDSGRLIIAPMGKNIKRKLSFTLKTTL